MVPSFEARGADRPHGETTGYVNASVQRVCSPEEPDDIRFEREVHALMKPHGVVISIGKPFELFRLVNRDMNGRACCKETSNYGATERTRSTGYNRLAT